MGLEANNSRPRNCRDSVGQSFIILIITLHLPWSSGGIFWGVDITHSFSSSFLGFLNFLREVLEIPKESEEGKKQGGGSMALLLMGRRFMTHLLVGVQ